MTGSPGAAAAAAAVAAATTAVKAAANFTPRRVYEASPSITRSYFLGHHNAAINRMRQVLTNIGLVIEVRDFRVPLTSWNPILESHLAEEAGRRARIIVYTKRDLGPGQPEDGRVIERLKAFHTAEQRSRYQGDSTQALPPAALFLGEKDFGSGDKQLLNAIKDVARNHDSLLGLRSLVVGMPNAGKSTLLNRLRSRGVHKAKAAATGAQPGVTRKLGTPVRIVDGDDAQGGVPGEGVFVMDTPGVFVPYVADPEAMLKLALVGCVKDGLVPAAIVADYLLYHLNLRDPALYVETFRLDAPTNDVGVFLDAVARRYGKLGPRGEPLRPAAADMAIQQWRNGNLGRFLLDEVTEETVQRTRHECQNPVLSMNQARIRLKEKRKERSLAKYEAAKADLGA